MEAKGKLKPFLIGWVIYSAFLLIVFYVVLVRPATRLAATTDFRCWYSVGVLARKDPAHIYDLARLESVQDTVGGETGVQVYIQPPYEALSFVPFSLFSYSVSYLLFAFFNLALLLPCFFFAREAFSHTIAVWQPRPGLLFFVFVPLAMCIMQGQAGVRFLLLCCLAWHELKRDRVFNAGLCLGLALFKMNIAVPLALLLVIRHGYKALAGFAAGGVIVTTVSVWLVGPGGMLTFCKVLLDAALRHSSPGDFTAPSSMPNLRGLLYGMGGRYLPHSALLVSTLLLSAILFLCCAYWVHKEADEATAFGVAIVVALLLSYHLHASDLTVLLLPIGLLSAQRRPYFVPLVSAFMSPTLLEQGSSINFLWAIPMACLALLAWRGSTKLADATQLGATGVEEIRAATT